MAFPQHNPLKEKKIDKNSRHLLVNDEIWHPCDSALKFLLMFLGDKKLLGLLNHKTRAAVKGK